MPIFRYCDQEKKDSKTFSLYVWITLIKTMFVYRYIKRVQMRIWAKRSTQP